MLLLFSAPPTWSANPGIDGWLSRVHKCSLRLSNTPKRTRTGMEQTDQHQTQTQQNRTFPWFVKFKNRSSCLTTLCVINCTSCICDALNTLSLNVHCVLQFWWSGFQHYLKGKWRKNQDANARCCCQLRRSQGHASLHTFNIMQLYRKSVETLKPVAGSMLWVICVLCYRNKSLFNSEGY